MNNFTLAQIQRLIDNPATYWSTGVPFLDARYQENPRPYYRLFYHLAQFLNPGLVVELGGWQGTAAAHFAAGFPGGTVVSIDHHTDPGDEVHRERMLEAVRQYPNLIYLRGWTWDQAEAVAALKKPIDILFIDSWHNYEKATKDWEDYNPLLSLPSLVICDDITTDRGPVIDRMDLFWEELPGQKYLSKGVLHDQYPIGFLKYG